jgi:hypothetical protein
MDSLSPQVAAFSFPEKYFKIIPEWRIRRYQFFVRFLIPW